MVINTIILLKNGYTIGEEYREIYWRMKIIDQGRFEGLDAWDFFLWPQSAKNMKWIHGLTNYNWNFAIWHQMLEMLSVLVLLRGCSSLVLTDFIVTGKKKEKNRSAKCSLKRMWMKFARIEHSQIPWRNGVEWKCTVFVRKNAIVWPETLWGS